VIDENPTQSLQSKTSIFSVPAVWRQEGSTGHSRAQGSKGNIGKIRHFHEWPTSDSSSAASPLRVSNPRRLSVPPFSPSPIKTKVMSRGASTPSRISTLKRASGSSMPPDPIYPTVSTGSPYLPNTPATSCSDFFHLGPDTPPYLHLPLDSASGRTTRAPQDLSFPATGPITPPAPWQDLLPEPAIVPYTSADLSPESSSLITNPFIQFQSQGDCSSNPFLVSPFDYSGSVSVYTGALLPKSTLSTPLGTDYLSYNIPVPMASEFFESHFLNPHAAF
jgi:hypothetical protein